MVPDLSAPIRTALLGSSDITDRLEAYAGSYPIFTRRPPPRDAPYPMIVVSPDVAVGDQDGLSDLRPVVERDVAVYGHNDSAENYRAVESIARAVRALFHRKWRALTVPDWKVVEIAARGPMPAPADDEQTVGRLVTLAISLAGPA